MELRHEGLLDDGETIAYQSAEGFKVYNLMELNDEEVTPDRNNPVIDNSDRVRGRQQEVH